MDGTENPRGVSAWDRLGLVLLPVFAVVVTGLGTREFLLAPFRAWNDTRLAPSAALLGGSDFYFAAGEGPLLGHIYAPIAPFFYLPAVLMPSPEAAVYLGTAMTSLVFFGPIFLLLYLEGKPSPRWMLVSFLVFCLFAFHERALRGPAFWIHVDAPALGFGALACAALYWRESNRARGAYLASAFAVVLAVGSKQVALPLAVALPLYLLVVEGRGAMARYLAWLAAAGTAVLAAVALRIDFEAMWFNAVTLPMRHPWKSETVLEGLGGSLAELSLVCLPIAVAVAACLALGRQGPTSARRGGWRGFVQSNPWLLLIFVALCFLPTSLLGFVKVGGDVNALAYTAYYGAAAALLLGLQTLRRAESREGVQRGWIAKPALLAAGGILVLSTSPALSELRGLYRAVDENPERMAWRFVTAQPRKIYFPFHPLLNLMAEGRAYHTSSGLMSQDLSGDPIKPAHLQAYLPEGMRFVAFRGKVDYSERYFPEHRKRVRMPALPGWTVLAR